MLISRLVAALFVLVVVVFVAVSTLVRDPAASASRLPADLDVQNVELASEPFDQLAIAYQGFDLETARIETHDLITSQAVSLIEQHLAPDLPTSTLNDLAKAEVSARVSDMDIEAFNALIDVEENTEEDQGVANVLAITAEEQRVLNFGDQVGTKTLEVINALQAEDGPLASELSALDKDPVTTAIRPRLTRLQRVAFKNIPLETLAPETTVSGSTSADRRTDIRARTGSPVAEILVDRGTRVSAGQTLVILDMDDRQARRLQATASIAQAEAGLIQAEANVSAAEAAIAAAAAQVTQAETSLSDAEEGLSDVLDLGEFASASNRRAARSAVEQAEQALAVAQSGRAQSDASLSQAKAGLAQSAATLESAKAALVQIDLDIERLEIKAPFDGLIEQTFVEIGASVNPGEAVVRLADLSTILVSARVSDSIRAGLRLGQTADVLIGDGPGQVAAQGEIVFIDSASDSQTRTFEVQVELANTFAEDGQVQIVDNQFAQITFKGTQEALYRIPQSALTSSSVGLSDAGATGLLTLDDDSRVVFTPIDYADYNDGGELLIRGDRIAGETLRLIVGRGGFVKPGDQVDARAVLDDGI